MRILYAEDEMQMSDAVCAVLQHNHFSVDPVFNGQDALDYALLADYDVIILDIMMPQKDGITVLSELRAKGIHTPVILLTAKSEVEDRIKGLDAGADDYLSKPFSTGELMARIRALSRRQPEYTPNKLQFENVFLDRSTFELSGPRDTLRLGNKEYQILELLLSSKGSPVSTDKVMERVWEVDSDAENNVVWVYISYLRRKLKQVGANVNIISARGSGYYLERAND
ncbi:MAG: response regulator transcription factor [Oscillospiraceae bacterium]|nr:response regulator transcription factor [Oscillospiraceae bacterium]